MGVLIHITVSTWGKFRGNSGLVPIVLTQLLKLLQYILNMHMRNRTVK